MNGLEPSQFRRALRERDETGQRYAPDMSDDPYAPLRKRAYELADTGRYSDWASLSADLVDEGSPDVIVRRLTYDALFQNMLKTRMDEARQRS